MCVICLLCLIVNHCHRVKTHLQLINITKLKLSDHYQQRPIGIVSIGRSMPESIRFNAMKQSVKTGGRCRQRPTNVDTAKEEPLIVDTALFGS
jgi:hypothetical protein